MRERITLWRFKRQALRRHLHMTPWRSCNDFMRGVCLDCYWRTLTGQHRRARAARIVRLRRLSERADA